MPLMRAIEVHYVASRDIDVRVVVSHSSHLDVCRRADLTMIAGIGCVMAAGVPTHMREGLMHSRPS